MTFCWPRGPPSWPQARRRPMLPPMPARSISRRCFLPALSLKPREIIVSHCEARAARHYLFTGACALIFSCADEAREPRREIGDGFSHATTPRFHTASCRPRPPVGCRVALQGARQAAGTATQAHAQSSKDRPARLATLLSLSLFGAAQRAH